MERSELPIMQKIFAMGAFGALIGFMIGKGRSPEHLNEMWFYVAASVCLFSYLGWRIVIWTSRTDYTYEYEAETQTPSQQTIIEKYFIVSLEGTRYRLSWFGMNVEQWTQLGQLVIRSGYSYKQDFFEQILGRDEGRRMYSLVSGALNYDDVFAVVYGNGFKLTDAGKEFFDKVAKGDWRVIDELPNE